MPQYTMGFLKQTIYIVASSVEIFMRVQKILETMKNTSQQKDVGEIKTNPQCNKTETPV